MGKVAADDYLDGRHGALSVIDDPPIIDSFFIDTASYCGEQKIDPRCISKRHESF